MINKKIITALLITLAAVLPTKASDYLFHSLGIHQGLTDNSVNTMMVDSHGYMWIGTSMGLNRYDGYEVRQFRHFGVNNQDAASNVRNIKEDAAGNIWVEYDGVTARYDAATQTFHTDNKEYIASLGLYDHWPCLTEIDSRGNLWLVSDGFIQYHDFSSHKSQQWKVPLKFNNSHWRVEACAEGLYFCDETCIVKFITKTGRIQKCQLPPSLSVPGIRVRTFVDSENTLWVYSLVSEELYHYKGDQIELPRIGGSNALRNIYDDGNGLLWIATDHNGVFIYNRQDHSMQHLTHVQNDFTSLASNNVSCIVSDHQGTIWLGHFKTGLSYSNSRYMLFKSRGLQYGDISVMNYDRAGNLWLGTDGFGVFVEHPDGSYVKAQMPDMTISSLLCDHSGTVWVGTYNNGLYKMRGTSVESRYTMESGHLKSNAVWQMTEDNHHNIWFSSAFAPLFSFSPATGKSQLYVDSNKSAVLATSLAFDGQHTLYAGTNYGIWVYDTNTGKQRFINGNMRGTQQLMHHSIVSLCYDRKRHALWAAHKTGITVLDIKKDSLRYIGTSNGLFDNNVKSIIPDHDGNMWISTGHGISCVQILSTGDIVVRNFTSNEGLQNTYFNTFAATCGPTGNVLMGGNEGYTMITPRTMLAARKRMQLMLTEVTVGGEIIPSAGNEVNISYDDNQIVFRFFTGDLTSSNRVVYAYRFKGKKSKWIYTDKNVVSTFSLTNGKHILEIKASNESGEWGETMQVVIHVAPPFYLAWWMWIVYLACVAFLVVMGYRYMIRRQQRNIEEQRVRMEQGHQVQLSEMKLRFFTNISHDLRTPLTLIISPLQSIISELRSSAGQVKALPDNFLSRLEMIHKNAQLLMSQVNMLLDFRRLDVGAENLNLQSVDLAHHLSNISLSFQDYAEERSIRLTYQPCQPSLFTAVDAEKVNKIMNNLLSNAFKFTPDGGSIIVSLNMSLDGNNVIISVADTGCGISAADKQHIFRRFYQVTNNDPKAAGSGIGLHIVNEYVTMHGGTISVNDNTPVGSIFTIKLPLRTQHDAALSDASHSLQNVTDSVPDNSAARFSAGQDCAEVADAIANSILVVDDNSDLCTYIADSLRTAFPKYHIITAANGKEALDQLEANNVALVVTDIMMPVIDGMQLCQRIKTTLQWSHIPVIMLTAKAADVNIIDGLRQGADDYLTKPFNIEHLVLRIEKFLEWTRTSHDAFSKKIEVEPSEITITSLDEEFVKKAIAIVEEHIMDSDFSVEMLGKELSMSRANLYKKMMNLTGKGPHDFIRVIRLKRAHQLLEKSQRQISEIAYEVGYSSPKRFSENFKAEFGMTPSEFVKTLRSKPQDA